MKNLTCVVEGIWKEDTYIELSIEEKEILVSGTDEEKKVVTDKIEVFVVPIYEGVEAAVAEATYQSNKPILGDGDVYQLIAVDISVDGDICTGIINCRVNGEHKQVRF